MLFLHYIAAMPLLHDVVGKPIGGAKSTLCVSLPYVVHFRRQGWHPSLTLFVWLVLQVNPSDDDELYHRMIELWFLFSMIWSIAASVDESGRKKIDNYIREIEGQFPAKVRFAL